MKKGTGYFLKSSLSPFKRTCKPGSVWPSTIRRSAAQVLGEMLIYLARPLLAGSSDLTRSDTDIFTVGASALQDRNLFGLAPRRDWSSHPASLLAKQIRLCPLILTLRWAAVSRYAARWSPDFPPCTIRRFAAQVQGEHPVR